MATQLQEVEFETRTIGPLVLTTPVLRRLGFREMVNRHCPIAEQAELDHGLVAELVTQSRLSDPTALYDLPGWAERFAIATLYPEIERTGQVKLFALATGDGGLPVWFDVLHGGTGDSTTYAPQFAAFSTHARLARFLPLEDIILIGDRKMPTAENQLTWLRLKLGYIGPMTLQDHHRHSLRALLAAGRAWQALPYVAKREAAKPTVQQTGYRGLGHSVAVTDPEDPTRHWSVRHLYIHSSALAKREAARRDTDMQAIEAELQRLQGLVNKYDYKTPEVITRRVQSKAFKKRPAQQYCTIEVFFNDTPPT